MWGVELLSWWRYYNELYLDSALREPVFRLSRGIVALGSYDPATRTLSISEEHVSRQSWLAVMETLRHEMAHQYAHEVLGAGDERPHGEGFRRACARLRVDARASGAGDEVSAPAAPTPGRHGAIVERISKLLSLSSSPNEHEAHRRASPNMASPCTTSPPGATCWPRPAGGTISTPPPWTRSSNSSTTR